MSLDSDNIIEQLAQIESDLGNQITTESEIDNIAQVDSVIGNVIPVDMSGFYDGAIADTNWVLQSGYYYYTVSHTAHKLANPFVSNVLVETQNGYDNPCYSYTRLPNDDIRFRSNIAINCIYRITGQR